MTGLPKQKGLTFERASELLAYDFETGILTWKVDRGPKALAGQPAGCVDKRRGYVKVIIDHQSYQGHHVAWLLAYGVWPCAEVDHENRVRSFNAFRNLRYGDASEQSANTSIRRDNTSGVKGVGWCRHRRKWRARLKARGREVLHRYFDDLEDAARAYAAAARLHHGDFANPERRSA